MIGAGLNHAKYTICTIALFTILNPAKPLEANSTAVGMQGIAALVTNLPAETEVTYFQQVEQKSVSMNEKISDEQIEKQKELKNLSATTDELRAKISDLEAKIKASDLLSEQKSQAIEAAKQQLSQ